MGRPHPGRSVHGLDLRGRVSDSYPRLSARTQRFTLGAPRNVSASGDGTRVVFLRSRSGTDRANVLWVASVEPGGLSERIVADPAAFAAAPEELSATERARRERSREGAGGIVGYTTDGETKLAAFTWSGRLFVVDLTDPNAAVRELPATSPVVDPRLDPTGRQIAYVSAGTLRLVAVDGSVDRAVAAPDGPEVAWGLAEFVAAEEMGRHRGYWWAPDGSALLAARVDNAPVARWHIADPAHPSRPPVEIKYPAAGTANADVSLHLFRLSGGGCEVTWDRAAFEYLAAVHWSKHGEPLLHVLSRDQRHSQVRGVDVATGATALVRSFEEDVWIDLVDGVPCWREPGKLLTVQIVDGQRSLLLEDEVLSGPLYFRTLLGLGANGRILFTASDPSAPEQVHVWRYSPGGLTRLSTGPGVHTATGAGQLSVLTSTGLEFAGRRTVVTYDDEFRGEIPSHAVAPPVLPAPTLISAEPRGVRTAVLLPADHVPGRSLPVLMDPYGGPHAQRVLSARNAFGEAQWWADQGFAVVVADGRGTPGRDQTWEWAVSGDLAGPVLADQIDALHAAAAACPDLDLARVGIRGWSFGGYLAALAVLSRPDVFHAGIAGAPVTDWALYDTHYTERYLGTPAGNPDAYARSSLITDGELTPAIAKVVADAASDPLRPLLIVHGLADDNVVAAHTLQLSAALLAAGRPHQVLPLSGVTHMTPQEVVAENLLLLQLDFLRRSLAR
ncbi:MAG: prolyl oligopeptidase family serine peptidase [Sporichthyaceae bacterium]